MSLLEYTLFTFPGRKQYILIKEGFKCVKDGPISLFWVDTNFSGTFPVFPQTYLKRGLNAPLPCSNARKNWRPEINYVCESATNVPICLIFPKWGATKSALLVKSCKKG